MPLFNYQCDTCGEIAEHNRPVDRRDEAVACTSCGAFSRRVFEPCRFKMPHKEWAEICRSDFLPPPKGERTHFTVASQPWKR